MAAPRVLIVDEGSQQERAYRAALVSLEPIEVQFEASPAVARDLLERESYDCLVASLGAADDDGLALLRDIRRQQPSLPIVMVSQQPTVAQVAATLREGASDFLTRPLEGEQLAASLGRLLHARRLDAENALLRRQVERPYGFDEFIGASPAMRRVFDTIQQVAESDVDVLVLGATGTGKELVARSIHRRSRRAARPFVPVDCGAIPENLLESELFGYERGAFTGAEGRRIGLLEFADGGTFFLDELGELPLVMQAKLLRTLQERKIRRVGGREEIDVDVRVVAATSRDLEAMVAAGQFREDLYYRINVVRLELPPLCARGDDLGLLVEHFATRYSREMNKAPVTFTSEAFQVLRQYRWPGNVRQLQNTVRRMIALAGGPRLTVNDLPDEIVSAAGEPAENLSPDALAEGQPDPSSLGFFQARARELARFEREYLSALLERHQGNVKTAAAEAAIPRGTLYRLLKNHGFDPGEFRRA